MKKMHIGIDEAHRKEIVQGLDHLLADTSVLLLQTQNFHWNVTGSMFQTLHELFEKQYNELYLATDKIAERIRALGFFAPGTMTEYMELSSIKEVPGNPSAMKMLDVLLEGHESAIRTARTAAKAARDAHDSPTLDLLSQRIEIHEKDSWMIRSLLA
jgi:starvation-inducible DNA-binding protein